VLQALSDGTSRPAGELARFAGVSAQTVSLHLNKLLSAGLLKVRSQGRFRYYSLRDASIAQMLESLALHAPQPPSMTPVQDRETQRLHFARTCYRHLAGHLGVAMTQGLCSAKFLVERENAYDITEAGSRWLARMGISLAHIPVRPLARLCNDWSERKPHVAGPLGDALAARLLALKWVVRCREPRIVRLTEAGRRGLWESLRLTLSR
jgi:DNA-binding transcriptional ArsR family regulator